MLVSSTFMIWYTRYDIDTQQIGMLTLLSFPYTVKFLWSPLLDRFALPWLDRRRGWIALAQLGLLLGIGSLALLQPDEQPLAIAILGLVISFLSASQDIAINAYQVEVLPEEDRAMGAAIASLGYRIAMFCMSTLILFIVVISSWHIAFICMSALVVIGMTGTAIGPVLKTPLADSPHTIAEATILPFKEFFSRHGFHAAALVLLIVIIYKLGDSMAFALNSVFFLRGLNFSMIDIAVAYKTSSLIFSLIGMMLGGLIVRKIGIYRGFLWFSLIMACANLMYLSLALVGKSYILMAASVAVEYCAGSMGNAVLVAFLLSLCNQALSATQFALFSSIDSLGRVFIGPFAAWVAKNLGWDWLFFLSFVCGLGTTLLIWYSKKWLCQMAGLTTPHGSAANDHHTDSAPRT